MTETESYTTQQEVAKLLNVSVRTVRNLIDRGDLPAYRLGGRIVRIRRADVEAILTQIPATRADTATSDGVLE